LASAENETIQGVPLNRKTKQKKNLAALRLALRKTDPAVAGEKDIHRKRSDAMKRTMVSAIMMMVALFMAAPVFAEDDLAKKLNDALSKGPEESHWWVSAEELSMWLKTGKTDFVVVDVRPGATAFKKGHIPGAIHIPYHTVLAPENLAKLPKDKKLVLVCNTGQLQSLPVVALRILGYDAATLTLGYMAWQKNSFGSQQAKSASDKAAAKNYPMQSESITMPEL